MRCLVGSACGVLIPVGDPGHSPSRLGMSSASSGESILTTGLKAVGSSSDDSPKQGPSRAKNLSGAAPWHLEN